MVYLAELLVAMTDRLKIVRIRARNVPRKLTHKCIDDDAFLTSLSCSRKATVSRANALGCHPVETKKSSPENLCMSGMQWPLSKKVVATVCPLHSDTKSEQSVCNNVR